MDVCGPEKYIAGGPSTRQQNARARNSRTSVDGYLDNAPQYRQKQLLLSCHHDFISRKYIILCAIYIVRVSYQETIYASWSQVLGNIHHIIYTYNSVPPIKYISNTIHTLLFTFSSDALSSQRVTGGGKCRRSYCSE